MVSKSDQTLISSCEEIILIDLSQTSTADFRVSTIKNNDSTVRNDTLATEEPMEIQVTAFADGNWSRHQVAVTMRTPGNDFELAAGFLLSEGVVRNLDDISSISYFTDGSVIRYSNSVNVTLSTHVRFDPDKLSRHTYTSSSCGICGKGSLEQVKIAFDRKPVGSFQIRRELMLSLPMLLKHSQKIFNRTGGLHASAIFTEEGRLVEMREDVARHNALDKLIGSLLLSDKLPASDRILLVSGRAGFELVQKAVIAGIPLFASVGAPSNLAVETAADYGMTLVGFLRDESFNIYCGSDRIIA